MQMKYLLFWRNGYNMKVRIKNTVINLLIFFILILSISCSKNKTNVSISEEYDLVIYTPHYFDKTEFIIREYRQRTGKSVKVIHKGTGELLSQLQRELESNSSVADVFWGGGIESLESNYDLFAPYYSNELKNIKAEFCAASHYWTGFSVMTMVIIYNKDLLPTSKIPKTWEDLLDSFFTNRIIMPDPIKSGSAYSILNAVLASSEEQGWKILGELKNIVGEQGLASSSSIVQNAVATGKYLVGLTSEDSALSEIANGSPLGIVYPSSGTIAVPDGVALVKNAPHEENAREFIDFVLSKEVQGIVPSRWYRRSVRNDVLLPIGADSFSKIKILPYDLYEAALKREEILNMWALL